MPETTHNPSTRWLIESLRSTDCPACGCKKQEWKSFCYPCYRRLPSKLKDDLYDGVGEGYEEAHAASMNHFGASYPMESGDA